MYGSDILQVVCPISCAEFEDPVSSGMAGAPHPIAETVKSIAIKQRIFRPLPAIDQYLVRGYFLNQILRTGENAI
jgi:hypothetical protein